MWPPLRMFEANQHHPTTAKLFQAYDDHENPESIQICIYTVEFETEFLEFEVEFPLLDASLWMVYKSDLCRRDHLQAVQKRKNPVMRMCPIQETPIIKSKILPRLKTKLRMKVRMSVFKLRKKQMETWLLMNKNPNLWLANAKELHQLEDVGHQREEDLKHHSILRPLKIERGLRRKLLRNTRYVHIALDLL